MIKLRCIWLLGEVVGIILNVTLFAVKFAIGFISYVYISVAVDAVNNLTYAVYSTMTIINLKIISNPAIII